MGLLLIGYFVAPRFIWRLSLAVHGETPPGPASDGADSLPQQISAETEVSRHD